MRRCAGVIAVAVVICFSCCVDVRAEGEEDSPRRVSLIRLISVPEQFDGKKVQTRGYLVVRPEGDALYVSKSDAEMFITMNAIVVGIPEARREEFERYRGAYVSLEGEFSMIDPRSAYLHSGLIRNITRVFGVQTEEQKWKGN